MLNKISKILIVGWCFWLIIRLCGIIFFTGSVIADHGAGIIIPLICFAVGYQLYKNPSRKLSRWFYFMCALVLCKFCLGNILYYYSATHTVYGAYMMWWGSGMKGFIPFVDTIGATLLTIATMCFWPQYCFKRCSLPPNPDANDNNTTTRS
jgi:hypothetical protein